MKILIAIALGGMAWGQTALDQPRLGTMIDQAARARPVFGVTGSVTLGLPSASGVVSSACSSQFCIVKTRSAVLVAGAEANAPVGPALFAIDGNVAYVYFPLAGRLAYWRQGQLDPLPLGVAGEILSLRVGANGLEFAVRRNGVVWIVDSNDQAIDSLPSAGGPVLIFPGGALYTDSGDVVLRRPDASELRFAAPEAEMFSPMSDNYVQIRAGRSNYALRIDAGHERMFMLPEAGR